jgi:hypothetical protein
VDWDYRQITATLADLCREGTTVNIFCEGVVLNRDRADGKQLGTTAVVLYQERKELAHWHVEQTLGKTVTETDTLLRALHPGLDALTDVLATQNPQTNIKTIMLLPSILRSKQIA